MKKVLDSVSSKQLILIGIIMAIMPIVPEPHLVQKAKMLVDGSLTKTLDIFDIFWHTLPFWILLLKKAVSKDNGSKV